jgi:hypothetical protein
MNRARRPRAGARLGVEEPSEQNELPGSAFGTFSLPARELAVRAC